MHNTMPVGSIPVLAHLPLPLNIADGNLDANDSFHLAGYVIRWRIANRPRLRAQIFMERGQIIQLPA